MSQRLEPWTADDDPLGVLLAEHRTILQVVDEAERESRRLEAGAVLREAFWQDLLRFADAFDTDLHHQKEEHLLFPALERSGLSADQGPTAVLRDEHRRIRHARDRVELSLGLRDRSRLCAAAAGYIDLLRSHVLKENQIVFPLARRLLAPAALQELKIAFMPLRADQHVDSWLRHPYAAAK